jgi:PAS domain S-box-containing protein
MKILVVEDDELHLYALSTVLTNQNYAVEVATDGNTAWELIKTYDYDLILLDVVLPKLDGISLCRQIRYSGRQVPILLLTGCDRSHEKAIGLDAGADDYVVKPFNEEELVARVRALLRRGSVTSQPILEWGNLRLDPSSREVTFDQNLVSLTAKEYALLELFLRNQRRVFSCGMILEHLWSYGDTPGEDAVRTHIKGLRMKLKSANAPQDLIETLYGIGYRLKPQKEQSKQGYKAANFPSSETLSTEAFDADEVKLLQELADDLAYGIVALRNQQQRELAELALYKIHDELELRVAERTAELIAVNEKLQSELDERQHTQEALSISQTRFEGILSIADDAIISIDGHQCITLFNQGAEKIFGYSAQEIMGKPLDLLLPMRFSEQHRLYVTDFGKSPYQARSMGERREIFGLRKDGTEFPAEASISKLNMDSECVYTVILRNITERKKIEKMKDEFVSVVSHELRTPLTSIHGSLGMLASGLLPTDSEQGKRLLQIATDSTDRLVRLINDILDIERIESGKVKMQRENCNLDELISSALNIMQPIANKAGVILSISSLSVQLWVDPDRIVQTLTNLLSNAIKFSHSNSTVWLTAQQQKNEILLTIKDTGRGIPVDKLDSIFERFQQVDSSDSRNHEGTGLGLAISKSIVQQHGGKIWVESALNRGSSFYLTLPVYEIDKTEFKNAATEGMLNNQSSSSVFVCDDITVIKELQTLLEEEGYEMINLEKNQEENSPLESQ